MAVKSRVWFGGGMLVIGISSLLACAHAKGLHDNSDSFSPLDLAECEAQIGRLNELMAESRRPMPNLIHSRCLAYGKVGMFKNALDDFKLSTSLQSEPEYIGGQLSEKLAQPLEAQKLYDQAVRTKERNKFQPSDCFEVRSRLDLVLGRNDQVIKDTTALMVPGAGFADEFAGYLATKALALHRKGKSTEAISCLEQAKKLSPSLSFRPQVKLVEAIILRDQNAPDKALKAVNLLYNLRPKRSTDNYLSVEEPAILALRATIYALQNQPDKAMGDLRFRGQIQNLPFNGESPYLVVAKNLRKAGNKKASDAFVRFAIADLEQQKKALAALK